MTRFEAILIYPAGIAVLAQVLARFPAHWWEAIAYWAPVAGVLGIAGGLAAYAVSRICRPVTPMSDRDYAAMIESRRAGQ